MSLTLINLIDLKITPLNNTITIQTYVRFIYNFGTSLDLNPIESLTHRDY